MGGTIALQYALDYPAGMRAWMADLIASGDKAGYESETEATFAFNVSSRLGEIAVPTTIIHGDEDAAVPVARAGRFHDDGDTPSRARADKPTGLFQPQRRSGPRLAPGEGQVS